jgi:two-component system response regulator YesN
MNGNLLIVEDQTFFRKGIRKMIEDHAIGWKVVGEAETGSEALEFIAEQQPDLVLTDIRMPGMDGIELAEHIHRNQLDIDIIILTGFEDFKYAQAALRYGASDFLLKPCNEETLIGVLQKAYELFLARSQKKQKMLAAERAKEEAMLRAFILRLPHESPEDRSLVARCLNQHLLFVFVSGYYPDGKLYQPRDLGLLQFALFNILTEIIDGYELGYHSVSLKFDRFALFLEGKCPEGFKSSAEQNVLAYLGIQIAVYPFGPITKPDDLPDFYDRFENAIALPTGDAERQTSGKLSELTGLDNQSKVKELQVHLYADIALGQVDKLKSSLDSAIKQLNSIPLENAKMEALTLAFAMNALARQSFDTREADSVFIEKIEQLQSVQNPHEAVVWTKKAVDAFLTEYENWKSGKNHNIIKRTMDYLDSNYMESCSLTEIAGKFHVSTAYFSKLFKKDTGDNYSTYLTKIRMQKAAMLLLNTEMKVFEIASAVGYDDPNYFTNVFRLIHKLSPSDYRKQKN